MDTATKKHVTLTSLSKELGLSVATVSSVLNNLSESRRISTDTVKKVVEGARKVGYIPNLSARRLKTFGTNPHPITIAIITSLEAPSALISEITKAFLSVSKEPDFIDNNYSTVVELFHAGKLREVPGILTCNQFNAAIIANTVEEDDKFLAETPLQASIVLIGREIENYSCVKELTTAVGKQAAKVLKATNSRHTAFLRPSLLTQATKERIYGFTNECMQISGTKPIEIISDGFSDQNGFEAVDKFLSSGQTLDGLFTVMDSLVIGAYHAIKKHGLKIPSDVTVIGSGYHPSAPHLDPPLSAFIGSEYNMHEEAVRLLFKQIKNGHARATKTFIPLIPVLRESTRRGNLPSIPYFNEIN